jgi:hypothetical protein
LEEAMTKVERATIKVGDTVRRGEKVYQVTEARPNRICLGEIDEQGARVPGMVGFQMTVKMTPEFELSIPGNN